MTTHKEKILIIDDEQEMLNNCRRILERFGYRCQILQESNKFSQVFQEDPPDLILTDLRMPKKGGIDILKEAKKLAPEVVVLLFTAFGTIESAIKACKLGAFDYRKQNYQKYSLSNFS